MGISRAEVTFARRGFVSSTPHARQRLEAIGSSFLDGYHAALVGSSPPEWAAQLDRIDGECRGFAYEGAAMALALQDRLIPGRRDRLARFLAGPGDPHAYLVHVGAGWAAARLGGIGTIWDRLDPLLRWLVLDGYGFHEGFFHWGRFARPDGPRPFRGYPRRVFDQGLGRSLWFVFGAQPGPIARAIQGLPPDRHPDLWSGVGLAWAYAGGAGPEAAPELVAAADSLRPHLAQGVAFAAKARERAGNPAEHTEAACRSIWGRSAAGVARQTDASLHGLPADGPIPNYEVWRARIRDQFVGLSAIPAQ